MSVPIVTIFGGSGFIGRYVAQRMARAGWRVRVAVRRPDEAGFVRPYGVVGQVEPIQANIRDEASTRRAIARRRRGDQLRRHPRREPASRPSTRWWTRAPRASPASPPRRASARLVHISAIGADPASDSLYAARQGPRRGGGPRRLPRAR